LRREANRCSFFLSSITPCPVLPSISIGKHAIVGAAAVVTKDVPDYAIVVGNPAKVVKTLDADKFED